jgi:hypothetical protein
MSAEFWGMTGFLITTILFSAMSLTYRRKLSQAQQLISQLKEKANQAQTLYCEKQSKK